MFNALVLEQDDAGKTYSEIRQLDNEFLTRKARFWSR